MQAPQHEVAFHRIGMLASDALDLLSQVRHVDRCPVLLPQRLRLGLVRPYTSTCYSGGPIAPPPPPQQPTLIFSPPPHHSDGHDGALHQGTSDLHFEGVVR